MNLPTIAYLVLAPEIGYRGMFFSNAETRCVCRDLEQGGYKTMVKELIERPTNQEGEHHVSKRLIDGD